MNVRELIQSLICLDMEQEIEVAVEDETKAEFAKIDYVCDWYGDKVPRIVCVKEDKG